MLAEYGLIPDIFETANYSSADASDLRLAMLKDALLQHGLVRDFRNGEWRGYVLDRTDRWDRRACELLKKLIQHKRLVFASPAGSHAPVNEADWCEEALASHRSARLTGIIAGPRTAAPHGRVGVVRSIEKLNTAPWWTQDRESVIVKRTTDDYLRHLDLVLKHANLLMFIDPHLDPTKRRYAEFIRLLGAASRPKGQPVPRLEIHRLCHSGDSREPRPIEHWRSAFGKLHEPLSQSSLTAEVFLWDQMHDRYVISDLIGILMGNGFDVSQAQRTRTTWSRISRSVREQIQREYDAPNNVWRTLHGRFTLGKAA